MTDNINNNNIVNNLQLELGPNDVYMGRGNGAKNHQGNIRKRELTELRLALYQSALSRQQRQALYLQVYNAIVRSGGRFLKKDGDQWIEATEEQAMKCISAGFNNADQAKQKRLATEQVLSQEEGRAAEVVHDAEPLLFHQPDAFPSAEPSFPFQPPSDAILPQPLQPSSVHHQPIPFNPNGLQLEPIPPHFQPDPVLHVPLPFNPNGANQGPLPLQAPSASPANNNSEPVWVQIERMDRERKEALEENQRLRALIEASRDARALAKAKAEVHQLRVEADQLRQDLAKSKQEVKQLGEKLADKPELLSLDEIRAVLKHFQAGGAEGDDSSELASVFEALSVDSSSIQSGQRRKAAKTSNANDGSVPEISVMPGGFDAETIITGLSDWKRAFVNQAHNLDEMKIEESLKIKHGGSYLGSVLRDKPHGLGVMRLKDRVMVANWNNGVAIGQACVLYRNGGSYYGRLEGNERHGEGLFIASSTSKDSAKKGCFTYVGNFRNDYRNGKGRFKFTKGHKLNGHEYEGDFAKGVFEGQGTHRFPNGTSERGRFANWKLVQAADDSQVVENANGSSGVDQHHSGGGNQENAQV